MTLKTMAKKTAPKSQPKQPVKTKQFKLELNLSKFMQRGLLYVVIALLFVPFLISLFGNGEDNSISLTQFVTDIREERVKAVQVAGNELRVEYKDGANKVARKEDGQEALTVLRAANIDLGQTDIEVRNLSFGEMAWELILSILPIALMFVLFMFFFRQARGAQDGIMGIGRSKAKLFVKGKQDTSFKDVGGMDEAKAELEEIVDFLRNPKKYTKVGARTPKGVLLVGPAGTGKTLLARAVAGEANVQFLSIAGSEFMEMLVGVGASRVRDLFAMAKKLAPSIIFIDEIDAIGRIRGQGGMGGHDEREQTLNQILVEMDGFSQNDNVIVMAATNRGDMLDPALVRPGRFDRRVMVNLPDLEERKYIISIHAKKKPFAKEVNWDQVAKRTVGFSGADIENMLNEAAISIARENREEITMTDVEEASLKVKLGPSKKRLQDKLEREMTAYHEAGHAVIAHVSKYADPVHRISIVSRGRALGFTLTPPERDKLQTTKSELIDEIAVLLGGRAAEELIFNEQTGGASSDIDRATRIARAMVMDYGMSDLGPMNFSPQYESSNYSRSWAEPNKISDALQEKVDAQVQKFVAAGQKKAAELLIKYRKELDAVSKELLEVESLDGDEFARLMGMPKVKLAETAL
ncbi:MAG: cell division protein FtsH [Candidatus Pacebacteria bacterium CG10_big_fil_rev_8_21_14_0_10_42_12]|nr:ATP-dependent zinc metalloprotease FtsH [Candidatus Paceibacterota bacterium]PIR63080.1 MAG: cell division protein FtsH [Candidatus Pacebacteria bacterium CG10_big_fil_rev_8_21_14_0_10_42_12]